MTMTPREIVLRIAEQWPKSIPDNALDFWIEDWTKVMGHMSPAQAENCWNRMLAGMKTQGRPLPGLFLEYASVSREAVKGSTGINRKQVREYVDREKAGLIDDWKRAHADEWQQAIADGVDFEVYQELRKCADRVAQRNCISGGHEVITIEYRTFDEIRGCVATRKAMKAKTDKKSLSAGLSGVMKTSFDMQAPLGDE